MKVRIKKIIKNGWREYAVQYKKFGLFWVTFESWQSYSAALEGAIKLSKWHGVYSIEEFGKLKEE